MPFTAFSEFNREAGGDVWFALDEDRPLAFFVGIWAPQWTSVRKMKTGEETIDVFAFLTTEPNAEVQPIHPKAMPVIQTNPVDLHLWMSSPWEIAKGLQRPLPDGALQIVSRGQKKDRRSQSWSHCWRRCCDWKALYHRKCILRDGMHVGSVRLVERLEARHLPCPQKVQHGSRGDCGCRCGGRSRG